MEFKARLCLFLLLSFALVSSARTISHSGKQRTKEVMRDYDDPGRVPGWSPLYPPEPPHFKVFAVYDDHINIKP
ncbi:hypothetical protein SDJN03_00921, partial [Cucurbita argyrosperma subsp. sororia]